MLPAFILGRIPRIQFGNGCLMELPVLARTQGQALLLITGAASLHQTEYYPRLLAALDDLGPALPCIAVPTTAGTGSDGFRKSFRHEHLVHGIAGSRKPVRGSPWRGLRYVAGRRGDGQPERTGGTLPDRPRLGHYGVTEQDIPLLVANSQQRNNPVILTENEMATCLASRI